MVESTLHARHVELGARFGTVAGVEVVRFYSDPVSEHLAVRQGVGVIDLSRFGAIKIAGSEAVQFLNGLVTNNVKTLEAGAGMRAAFLTGHGKVRGLCRILNMGEAYLVVTEPATHEAIFKYVFPFSYAGDFKVDDVSQGHRIIAIQGPGSHLLLKEICFEPAPLLDEHCWFGTSIAGHRAAVIRASRAGDIGFDVLVSESALEDVWDFILLKGRFHSIVPFGLEALDSLRIEAGVPEFGIDIDESNMMLEVGLDDAVSLTKGCYTGQEAVAMATYRGHVSKRISGLAIEGDTVPRPGDVVTRDGKEIGHITSALLSPSLGSVIGLAYLKYGFFDPNTQVEVNSGMGPLPSIVVQLPFYRPATQFVKEMS